ncbi:MAG: Uncharacterized protein G01um101477_257 [Candidatus Doudnabacteria bacterium Gr01-1014_77]|uniref:Bacterial type II secretion system protein E domain-containing protein n=1 Tax=Candidatus Doudnabacteria bacterium Gr01-1014_77 TaxID=2017133 RepID=A0A554JCJ6_9BACT|nr:MAG: Uncharacterized protein G01um101477_257 [Candidatus Doudnabacteria bacterium Gr01-1014_77]
MQLQDEQKQKDFQKKLTQVNRKMEEEQASQGSFIFGVPYIDLSTFPIDLNAMSLWSEQQCTDSHAVVFYKEGNDVRIATTDPQNPALNKNIESLKIEHGYKVSLYFVSESSLQQAFKMFPKVVRHIEAKEEGVEVKAEQDYAVSLKELEDGAKISATQILSVLLGAADKHKASDIHIEPEEHFIKIRFRLDGVLQDMAHLTKDYQKTIISRIKILSHLKLNVEDIPQDGRFTYMLDSKPTDVRVSVLPSAYGEGVVMRILGMGAVSLKLKELGFSDRDYELIQKELEKPNGMIITTGPTGSGKTTTLYAFLNQLNEPGVKIITLEDPVEYKLEGINQTPIDSSKGLTFAAGLRAILRQDPDVVMVGEVRDQETAEVALQAALTGHVVLSTLHTNDAAGAIPRLRNMGIKPYVIAPGMNAIIAQRLVRKLCPDCKQEVKLDPFLLEKVQKILNEVPKNSGVEIPKEQKFFHSTGCEKCNKTGYRGRIGIYELIIKDDAVEKLILAEAGSNELKQAMITQGMLSMVQDGLVKALSGITDVEEVFRVAQE